MPLALNATELVNAPFCGVTVSVTVSAPDGDAKPLGGPEESVKLGGKVPVPERATACGDPLALSAMLNVAEKPPAPDGLNVTEILQLAAGASGLTQFDDCPKADEFVPVIEMLLKVSGALPVFVSVAVCAALVVPEVTLNVSVEGLRDATGAVPIPLNAVVCGEPVALSDTFRVAEKPPAAFGAKVTEMAQLELAASEEPQLFVWPKLLAFAPMKEMLVMLSGAFPELVSVAP